MNLPPSGVKPLYNDDGSLYAVLLSPEVWKLIRNDAFKTIRSLGDATAEDLPPASSPTDVPPEPSYKPEPLQDWEDLKNHWDFSYPVDKDVQCSHCGSKTDDWEKDAPRLFRLSAANLGGLVSFRCLSCGSRITKKHFKDSITTECHPPQNRDLRKMGLYRE